MPWDDEPLFDLPWDEDLSSSSQSEPPIDSATLLHHFNLLSLPTPPSLAPCHIPLLTALIELRRKDEKTIANLRADLRLRDSEIRETRRQHRCELRALAPATAAVEAVKAESSRLGEKLIAAQKREQKLLTQLAASEKLVEHYQGLLRRREGLKTPVMTETVDKLVKAEEPIIEVSKPFESLLQEEPEPEEDEELTELEIYRGLVEGG